MSGKAIRERNFYIEPDYDDDFEQSVEAVTALDILHHELTLRDAALNKLKAMAVQTAGMGAMNAKEIAEIKRILAALEKTGQLDLAKAGEEAGRDFVGFLNSLPDAQQEMILDRVIEIARKARSAEDFDQRIDALMPSLMGEAEMSELLEEEAPAVEEEAEDAFIE